MKIKKYIKFWRYPQVLQERETLIEERDSLKGYLENLHREKERAIQEKEQAIREKDAVYGQLTRLSSMVPELRNLSKKMVDIGALKKEAREFKKDLDITKEKLFPTEFSWYPYNTLNNFESLDLLLTGKNRFLLELIGEKPIVDIGCADGDLAFFFESLGYGVRAIDYAPTNFNHLQGIRALKSSLSSSVEIEDIDLDAQFVLPERNYSLVFFLGILYHLKNPYHALETLAKSTDYCLLSTRVTKYNALAGSDHRLDLSSAPIAYLLDDLEANNDSTNYWIFSNEGLQRILRRTGWEICDYITVGNTTDSDPASLEGDERAFCLVKSRFGERSAILEKE
jgi:2-polyprenyl-3-methyl-5-hydroxy-6-metoxy-1,4-benzoquinol methylase